MYTFYIDGLALVPHVSVGSQALVVSAMQILRRKFTDACFYFTCGYPEIEDTLIGMARFCHKNLLERAIHYTIVGDGPVGQLQRLKDLASTLGLANRVTFTGWVMHDHLGSFLEQCNMGVSYVPLHPCYDRQPPTKTFEYLFAGMPVVATRTTENCRIINDTNGVLIEDTAEGFWRGLCEIASRLSTFNSEAIRVSVEDYSWQRIMCQKVLPYIQSVVAK